MISETSEDNITSWDQITEIYKKTKNIVMISRELKLEK